MSLQVLELLSRWHPQRDEGEWVLGTVVDTRGPVYRKTGALMLFGDRGQQLGLLSGGCLEADIALNARKVAMTGDSRVVTYDGSDEDDVAYQLGIGCGGSIDILLQVINASNAYHGLDRIYEALSSRQSTVLCQPLPSDKNLQQSIVVNVDDTALESNLFSAFSSCTTAGLREIDGGHWFVNPIRPAPALFIAGGGVDVQPLALLAATMGWHVTVWDPRPANGRPEHFPSVDCLLNCDVADLGKAVDLSKIDAAIVMSHKLSLDASALVQLLPHQPRYLALLGPQSRRERVLEMAGLLENDLPLPLSGPAGLYLGGDLPESVALSILAECHAVLHNATAHSLSDVLSPTKGNP